MHWHRTASVVGAALLVGCAGRGRESDESPATVVLPPTRWYGVLMPMNMRTASVRYIGQTRVQGEAQLVRGRTANESQVLVRFSSPLRPDLMYSWGLHTGRCGSGTPSVVPVNSFPLIGVRGDGVGVGDVYLAMPLPDQGSYHVNIFLSSSAQLSDVVSCANLRADRPRAVARDEE